jgi:hypothetical protein
VSRCVDRHINTIHNIHIHTIYIYIHTPTERAVACTCPGTPCLRHPPSRCMSWIQCVWSIAARKHTENACAYRREQAHEHMCTPHTHRMTPHIILHHITLHITPLHHTTMHCTTLHYTAPHFTTLHHTTLHPPQIKLHGTPADTARVPRPPCCRRIHS